jgi:hypothetical protein
MARDAVAADATRAVVNGDAPHRRCMCCNGVIENLREEAFSIGLDLRLGLVSDECVLICK